MHFGTPWSMEHLIVKHCSISLGCALHCSTQPMYILLSSYILSVTLDSGRDKHRLEKTLRQRFLEGHLQEPRMPGASAATPGNERLHREFKTKVYREHALKSSVETQRDPRDKGESSRFKLREYMRCRRLNM